MTDSPSKQEHINRVVSVQRRENALSIGNTSGDVIRSSWLRCLKQHGLHPGDSRRLQVLPQQEILEHKDRMSEFMCVARLGMESLYKHVASMNYVLLLTDMEGVTVDYLGDRKFEKNFRNAGLYLGSVWNEAQAGTNAVGVCLTSAAPVICHRTEHFFSEFISLTCTAAPIFDPFDNLIATLDISSLYSVPDKESQYLTLQLVLLYAKKVESANFFAQFVGKWVIRFGKSNEFVDVIADDLIALDGNGKVIGATQSAARTLHTLVKEMLGRSILNYFDCTLESLFSASWENRRLCMTARDPNTHGGLGDYFADVTRLSDKSARHYSPNNTFAMYSTTKVGPDIPSPAETNYPPKIRLMLETLRSNRWNITDTANELNISRSTIYRRIRKYGIVPPNQQGIG